MSFLDRIAECNAHDLSHFRPFIVAGERVGWMRHALAERLATFDDIFTVKRDAVRLSDRLDDFKSRTDALDAVVRALEAEKIVKGRRDEPYPVGSTASRRRRCWRSSGRPCRISACAPMACT